MSSGFVKKDMIQCEICGTKSVLKKDHFRCHFCKKYHCDQCARSVSVYVGESQKRLRSMRICKSCQPKKKIGGPQGA